MNEIKSMDSEGGVHRHTTRCVRVIRVYAAYLRLQKRALLLSTARALSGMPLSVETPAHLAVGTFKIGQKENTNKHDSVVAVINKVNTRCHRTCMKGVAVDSFLAK